jgi:hypothetical protein
MIKNADSPGIFPFYNVKNSVIMNPEKIIRGGKVNRTN